MANRALKDIFQDLHSKMTRSVSPDSVMDDLFSEKIINDDDYRRLRQVSDSVDRCREMLLLLRQRSHPQAFIYLRLSLLDEYPWIVDEIDKKIPSLTSQLQQLQMNRSSDGKIPSLTLCSYRHFVINPDVHFVTYGKTFFITPSVKKQNCCSRELNI